MDRKQHFFTALLALVSLILLLCGCTGKTSASADAAAEPEAALYAVKVGKGDALILRLDGKAYLIDAGKRIRWGQVHTALNMLGIKKLDAVFLTHTDNDHCGGLMPLALSEIEIGAWYAPAFYCEPKKEKSHPAVQAAAVRGQSVTFLYAGDTPEGVFTVLAPLTLNKTDEDENSLVMRVVADGVTILLTGDMEHREEKELVNSDAELACTVLKVPNHGDRDACSVAFIGRTQPQLAVISTDPDEKPGTPDDMLLEDLDDAGITVLRTDLCKGVIRIACKAGEATADELELPAPADVTRITLTVSDEKTELITVKNSGKQEADLTGCYLVSLKKQEVYLFPAGTVLAPGQTLTVGTLSTPEDSDLIWGEKNVFSKKKEDGLTLYDAGAAPVLTYWIGE